MIIFYFILILLPAILILLIAYIAAQSRKKKQQKLLNSINIEAIGKPLDYSVVVRYNSQKQQTKLLKIAGFQGSGVLYVADGTLYFKNTKDTTLTFDLKNTKIEWVGVELISGLLKWFSVNDGEKVYYFNIESGMFIFNTGGKKITTKSVYEQLKALQQNIPQV